MKKAFYMDSIAKEKRILLDIVISCFLEFGNGDSRVGVECTARPKKRWAGDFYPWIYTKTVLRDRSIDPPTTLLPSVVEQLTPFPPLSVT